MSTKKAKAAERAERAAALLAEQKRKERKRRLLSIGTVVAAVVLIVGGAFVYAQSQGDVDAPVTTDYNLVVGDDAAPHTVIIYEDFLCPVCGVLEGVAGESLTALAEEGRVQLDYRPVSILSRVDDYSSASANAFFVVREASGDEVAKEFHDLLFADQPSESGPFPSTDDLIATAVEAGAVEDDVRDGIEDGAQDEAVEAATEEFNDTGASGTPTVLLDGEVFDDGANWEEIGNNLVAAVEE